MGLGFTHLVCCSTIYTSAQVYQATHIGAIAKIIEIKTVNIIVPLYTNLWSNHVWKIVHSSTHRLGRKVL